MWFVMADGTGQSGQDDRVSIPADLRERVARLEEQMAGIARRMDDGFAHRDDALRLQAKETERRLEGLNHENARILAQQAASVSRDVYDADRKATELALSIAKEQADMAQGAGVGRTTLVMLIVALIGAAGVIAAIITNLN